LSAPLSDQAAEAGAPGWPHLAARGAGWHGRGRVRAPAGRHRGALAGWGQFCIDNQLAAALRGDVKKGLFFRGVGALPFGAQIRSVRDLMAWLLTPMVPAAGAGGPAARG
jgi:hypothetical protein